jgi:hypothetical protein
MRPQQGGFNKRGRNRNRNGGGGGGGGGGGNNNNKPQNILHRNFESTGPDVKVRGNAQHVYEKYLQLARDANSSGDRVMAENYLQHAEHYYRIIAAAQAAMPQHQPSQQQQHNQQQNQNGRYGQPHNAGEASEGEGERREEPAGATVESTAPAPQPAPAEDEQPVV